MHRSLLDVLRCPFCGTAPSPVEGDALRAEGDRIEEGVLGCECCAFPVVAGIPVLIANDATREAMHALEAGRREDALFALLGVSDDAPRRKGLRDLMESDGATYRDALGLLCDDAEGVWALHRFSDPV